MKSKLQLLLFLVVITLFAAASCSVSPQEPTAGNSGDNSSNVNNAANGVTGVTGSNGVTGSTGSTGGTTAGCAATSMCNGVCADLSSDPTNCGVCGNACGAGQDCQVAVCRCQGALTDCGGTCIATGSDFNNCGDCGMPCATGQVCDFGACAAGCSAGLTDCGGGCVNTSTNTLHCGGCSAACAAGQSCVGGMCQGGAAATTTGGAVTTTTGAGGAGATGSTTGTSTTGVNDGVPPGWWTYDLLSWAGCAWTGVDSEAGSNTTVVPQDFTTLPAGDSYCVTGTVGPLYEAVSLLGFNLAEDSATANCTYDPAKAMGMGPPGIALSGSGIAVNLTKSSANTLRVQIQGPNGATDANDRWCATITGVQGKVFVPFSEFNTECWEGGMGSAYNNQPISAVVFTVPGTLTATPYDYCIHGFATGSTAEDAPDGGGGEGTLTGTIGGAGSDDLDFQRVKVSAGGKEYIIQNNNWGNPGGTNQLIRYTNNSFVIEQETGGEPGGGAPASFPSIFIGANGDTQGGAYSTTGNDNLPKVVSTITSVPTTFAYNRASGDYNATYDVWFSANNPNGQEYQDGISGFVMVWLYKPPNHNPIGWGQAAASGVSLAGHTWDVYVGPRGGATNANAPVVSYIISGSPIMSMDFDLMEFIRDAEQHGINQSWFLTDVFAGFEIWNGSGTTDLAITDFTAVVN